MNNQITRTYDLEYYDEWLDNMVDLEVVVIGYYVPAERGGAFHPSSDAYIEDVEVLYQGKDLPLSDYQTRKLESYLLGQAKEDHIAAIEARYED